MKFKQSLCKICLFAISLFLLMPQLVQAYDLPVPVVGGEVKGTEAENLGIVITWEIDSSGQYGYKVEREDAEKKEIVVIYNPAEVGIDDATAGGFYLDTDLVPDNTYTYWVTTFDRAGEESEPGVITLVATIETICQLEFTKFELNVEKGTVSLAWNKVCSAVEYKLYRDGELVVTIEETNYTDENVPKGDHQYKLEAYNEKTSSKSILIQKIFAADPIAETTANVTVGEGSSSFEITSPLSGTLQENIGKIVNIMFGLAAIVALIFLIMGGYNYMTSGGDPEAQDAAKSAITNAIIGLVIILLSYTIVIFVLGKLGASITL